ncbi:hypothetical protein F383_36936 [Gossypium arboreum]|uniref:Uncharacterized protein n=1 Tax=Gossypium arboreum TaxID=29729 RepID=A0A0B0MAU7_GOSAR|nr:hypothetical protein F383_36936 [Gossypium arboreum]
MSLGLPFWSSSYFCCRLTIACMSLPIYQLKRAYCFELIRAYHFSSLELTVYQLRRSLPIMAQKSIHDNELTDY